MVGLTNEIARTGSQSVYIDFEKIQKARKSAVLMSSLLPVQAGQPASQSQASCSESQVADKVLQPAGAHQHIRILPATGYVPCG